MLALAGLLCAFATVAVGEVTTLSIVALEAIEGSGPLPNPWVVRLFSSAAASKTEDEAHGTFEEVSDELGAVAGFASLDVDESLEAAMIHDIFGVASLPSIRMIHSLWTLVPQPRGIHRHSRPHYSHVVYNGKETNKTALKEFVLLNSPVRYSHPLTHDAIDSVRIVSSTLEVELALNETAGDYLYDPQGLWREAMHGIRGALYVGRMGPKDASLLATISATAARLGPRIVAFATRDDDVARHFGATVGVSSLILFDGDAFRNNDPLDRIVVRRIETSKGVELAEVRAAMEAHAVASSAATAAISAGRARQTRDARSMIGVSPLQMIERTWDFLTPIADAPGVITALFLLRRTDANFRLHHRTAVDVARAVVGDLSPARFLRPVAASVRVVWVDAEVHPTLPTALGAATVPAVVFLTHVQSPTNPPATDIAAKFFYPPKIPHGEDGGRRRGRAAREWPGGDDVVAYLRSENFLEVHPAHHKVSIVKIDAMKLHDDALRMEGGDNARFLFVEADAYDAPRAPTWLADVVQGNIVDDAEEIAEAPKAPSARELRRVKEMEREIREKRIEKEERMKKKEEERRVAREAEIAEGKRKRKRERMEQRRAAAERASWKFAPPPAFDPKRSSSFDFTEESEAWASAVEDMVQRYVKSTPDGIRVGTGYSPFRRDVEN